MNQASFLARADWSSLTLILRLMPGLVIWTSEARVSSFLTNPEGGFVEKSGLDGSSPSFFSLCIQPPCCVPATFDGDQMHQALTRKRLTCGMLKTNFPVI